MKIINNLALKNQLISSLNCLNNSKIKELLGIRRWKKSEMSLSLIEILTSIIDFKYSGVSCLKSFWFITASTWNNAKRTDGKAYPCYQVYHKWFGRCARILSYLLDIVLTPLKQGLGFIDSAKLPIGECCRFMKSMGKMAGKGHSSTGEFYGLKLHALINDTGGLCAYKVTPGNVHDLTPVKNGFLDGQTGRIHGDKGYVGREVYFKLMEQNLLFLGRPRQNMGSSSDWSCEYVIEWEKTHQKEYRKRLSIERYFARLKRGFNLCVQGLRSLKMAHTYIYSSLLACQWELQGLIKIEKIV